MVAESRLRGRWIESVPVVGDAEAQPAVRRGVDRDDRARGTGMPGDVAQRLVDQAQEVGGRLGIEIRRSSNCGSTGGLGRDSWDFKDVADSPAGATRDLVV